MVKHQVVEVWNCDDEDDGTGCSGMKCSRSKIEDPEVFHKSAPEEERHIAEENRDTASWQDVLRVRSGGSLDVAMAREESEPTIVIREGQELERSSIRNDSESGREDEGLWDEEATGEESLVWQGEELRKNYSQERERE